MRIISGQHKGRRLVAPKNLPVRPTTDMAKEALFNILNNQYYFDELSVLDLFAGTGNISFEFASRGTTNITAIDKHHACIKYIEQVSNELDLNIHTVKADVFVFLENLKSTSDIIFADPPYQLEKDSFARLVELVFDNELLSPEGLLIIEHSKHTDLSHLKNFEVQKRYGGNCFSFFNKKADL
jgi:16S rRNA (guanine966-N2)-methyltransferase